MAGEIRVPNFFAEYQQGFNAARAPQMDAERNALLRTQMDQRANALAFEQAQAQQQTQRGVDLEAKRAAYGELVGRYQSAQDDATRQQLYPLLTKAAAVVGERPPEPYRAPVPFEQTDDYRKLQMEQQGRERLERLRASLQPKEGVGGLGKPPPGYRWSPEGNLQAIPGGPADIKATADAEKTRKRAEMASSAADMVIGTIDSALSKVGRPTAGTGSGLARKVGYEPAVDFASDLETIKANLGFDRLQAMREASPTGGALGAVAVQELIALQSTVASLDPAQSPAQIKRNLEKIKGHYQKWQDVMRRASGETSDDYLNRTEPSVPSDIADLLKKY